MKKTKACLAFISTLVAIIFLVACAQEETVLLVTDSSIEMNASRFSGTKTHSVTLRENDVIAIDTRGNTFDIQIVNEVGEPLPFFGNGIRGSNLQGTIPEPSEYTITVTGSGQFRISWD